MALETAQVESDLHGRAEESFRSDYTGEIGRQLCPGKACAFEFDAQFALRSPCGERRSSGEPAHVDKPTQSAIEFKSDKTRSLNCRDDAGWRAGWWQDELANGQEHFIQGGSDTA